MLGNPLLSPKCKRLSVLATASQFSASFPWNTSGVWYFGETCSLRKTEAGNCRAEGSLWGNRSLSCKMLPLGTRDLLVTGSRGNLVFFLIL